MSFDIDAGISRVIGEAGIGSNDSFPVIEEVVLSPADRIRAGLLSTAEVKALTPADALVDGLLFLDSLAMLYGASGIGKSFLAADIALHIAYASWWQGRPVTGGRVLYVIAEGASGFGLRIEAWERHNRLRREVHPVRWLPWAVNLSEPAWAGALAEVVAEEQPVLVVIDTFARCAAGAEENSARDVGMIVANLDTVRRAAGCCVLLVHHAGKDTGAGARGSSALRAAMHTELEVTGDSARFMLKNTKQKDAPEAPPIPLGLRPVDGTNSAVVDKPGGSDPDQLPAGVAATLAALESIDIPGGASVNIWRQTAEVPERSFYRYRKGLLEQGRVVNVGTESRPRYRPASALQDQGVEP